VNYDPIYQDGYNGPLSKHLRDRLTAIRSEGVTLAEIGDTLKFSGPFVSQLLNPKHPARIQSIHIPRIVRELEAAEKRYKIAAPRTPAKAIKQRANISSRDLAGLVRAINAQGFEVALSPLRV
jgi:hypothetical protein